MSMMMMNSPTPTPRDAYDLQVAEAMQGGPDALRDFYSENGFHTRTLGNLFNLNDEILKLINDVLFCGMGYLIDVNVGVAGLRTEVLRVLYMNDDFYGYVDPDHEDDEEEAAELTRILIDSLDPEHATMMHELIVYYEMGGEIDAYAENFRLELERVQHLFWDRNDAEMAEDD